MASFSFSATLQCTSKTQQGQARPGLARSRSQVGSNHVVRVATPINVEGLTTEDQQGPENPKFMDRRWNNGTWDLNMFVKAGKMNWDSLIEAEAKRRRFLELYPEASTNEEPIVFRSSIIPWWAWLKKSYLPQAELINGRAAMVGFFTSYVVDALTGLDMVGQTGNFLCKLGLFAAVVGVVVFRRSEDLANLKNLADEATSYDRQWQSSWQDSNSESGTVSSDK